MRMSFEFLTFSTASVTTSNHNTLGRKSQVDSVTSRSKTPTYLSDNITLSWLISDILSHYLWISYSFFFLLTERALHLLLLFVAVHWCSMLNWCGLGIQWREMCNWSKWCLLKASVALVPIVMFRRPCLWELNPRGSSHVFIVWTAK